MNLLDSGRLSPDFLDISPHGNTRKESCISLVNLGFLLN